MGASTIGPGVGDPIFAEESVDSGELARIAYWVDVYGQILKYKERVLTFTLQEADLIASDVARRYVMEADTLPLTRQVEVCLARYQFWTRRLDELTHGRAAAGGPLVPFEES